jgi:glycosyltransferase involved in cell wall biosynthesis
MVDPSWSIAYAKTGDHFNRVVIDGMIEGAIPIARNLGVATNSQGIGEVLKPDENYMMVPHDATPLEFANVIEDTLSLPNYVVQEILENNLVLLDLFSRHNIANQYIELANNEPTGYYKKLEVGVLSPAITKKTQQVMTEFFKYDGVNYG